MMNDLSMEQPKEDFVVEPIGEEYTTPHMLVFGNVMTLARGSGSGDTDGCSSGRYDE